MLTNLVTSWLLVTSVTSVEATCEGNRLSTLEERKGSKGTLIGFVCLFVFLGRLPVEQRSKIDP